MNHIVSPASLSARTHAQGRAVLLGNRRGWRAIAPFAGPAVMASVAYMDPGNYATNIQAGAGYGYALLWVVVLANLVAMLFQSLSARLGIVTGKNLAELSRAQFPRTIVLAMWVVSEFAAMATDLAEFLGGAIGLSLLSGISLMAGMVVTGIVTYAILMLQRVGFRPLELVITALIAVIGLSYVVELVIVPPDWGEVALHSLLPHIADAGALTLCVGIVGATVMPHAIYLHSALTQDRIYVANDDERRRLLRYSNIEVVIALAVAGLINMAMLTMAAGVFHDGVHDGVAEIETAYRTLVPVLGAGAGIVFLISLTASGLSSSAVGTMAGQVVMQGFVGWRIPVWVRRLATMAPAFAVVAAGVNPTAALIGSQVALSLALPVPMIALLIITGRRSVMGDFATGRLLHGATLAATAVVLALNAILIVQTVQAL